MSLPTLLIKGNLHSTTDNAEEQKHLDTLVPIEYIMDWLRDRQQLVGLVNRVLILKSETASGKSTSLPPAIYRAFMRDTQQGMAVTQPRTLTAIENVKEIVKWHPFLRIGKNIGWSTKFNKLQPQETAIVSMTVGTLVQQLKVLSDEQLMTKYKYILLDEVHERDISLDLAISMLKGLLYRNKDKIECPYVILMSATFDPAPFMKFFDVPITNFIWVTGMTAPIDMRWDWNGGKSVSNYLFAAADVVAKIVAEGTNDTPDSTDILIFLPGRKEFTSVHKLLDKLNAKIEDKLSILYLDGDTVSSGGPAYKLVTSIPIFKHQVTIGDKTYVPKRRCILATNVAETGLTLNNLKYVIDAGFNRETEYNPIYGTNMLITRPAPQSRIRQRKGRAGRRLPGVFYPLYTKELYDQLQVEQYPQILVNDLGENMLTIINEQLRIKSNAANGTDVEFNLTDLDMVDPPTPDALRQNMELLYSIGFITTTNSQPWMQDMTEMINAPPIDRFGLTKLGAMAVQFNMLAPESIRMIQAAYLWKCSILDTITIATWLKYKKSDWFKKPEGNDKIKYLNWTMIFKEAISKRLFAERIIYRARLTLADDFLMGLMMFTAIKNQIANQTPRDAIDKLSRWCGHNYVNYETCIRFMRDRDEIIEQMITMGVEIFKQEQWSVSNAEPEDYMEIMAKIKYCIYDGYRNNILTRVESKHGNKYHTRQGLQVMVPSMFAEDELNIFDKGEYGFTYDVLPKVMIYSGLVITWNKKSKQFDISVDKISALDGFISYDKDFNN